MGELSAINAIAGSYAESVPVIHIAGAPSKEIQSSGRKTHHSLGDGDYRHFFRMANETCAATADLETPTATWEIDRVIRTAMYAKKPGYLVLAADVAASPATPPQQPLELIHAGSTPAAEKAFEEALRSFLPGKKITVMADLLVHRIGASENLHKFLEDTGLPVATLSWGKTLVDESSAEFIGIYAGAASTEPVRKAVEEADALITVGVEFTDNITAGFSNNIDPSTWIDIARHEAHVGPEAYTPLSMERALEILAEVVKDLGNTGTQIEDQEDSAEQPSYNKEDALTQDMLWNEVAEHLDSDDIVLAEQGTSFFGMSGMRFPQGATFIGQPMWGSIGYTLPAAVGAGVAEPDRRPVLLIGDGSAQLTIQEIGQMVREKIPAIILLVNNSGYTVERAIHGMNARYNDIPEWNWKHALPFFGGAEDSTIYASVNTYGELQDSLSMAESNQDKLVFIEVKTAKDDAPELLREVARQL